MSRGNGRDIDQRVACLIMYGKPVCMSTVGGAILRLIGVIRRKNILPNGLLATEERGDRAIVTKWRKR
jgi:hypothetical protein